MNRFLSHNSRRFKFRFELFNSIIFLLVVVVIGSSFYLYTLLRRPNASGVIIDPNAEIDIRTESKPLAKWWDMNWKSGYQLKVINPTYLDVSQGEFAQFSFDHKTLVDAGMSLSNGNDLRLVYEDSENKLTPLQFVLESENTPFATISFRLSNDLPKRFASFRYFLYYNNSQIDSNTYLAPKTNTQIKSLLTSEIESKLNPVFTLNIARKWYLKGSDLPNDYKILSANIQVNPDYGYNDRAAQISIDKLNESASLSTIKQNAASFTKDVSSLNPGKYKLNVKIDTYESNFEFIVSYPLYATWSMDWEGYDVKNEYLDMMDSLANTYGMPITHFFNPRIYVTPTISSSRSKYLTDWVKARNASRDDEISMHLHMQYDFVEAAGVEKRTEIAWTPSTDGYEVLTSNYTPEEFTKIVTLGLKKFEENGLAKPTGYRAGGWFINLEDLKVLPSLGFKYDSSGRDYYIFGKNKIKGFWNLNATTMPYKISSNNQNSGNPPTIDLWEFPNNGADSTNQEASVMIGKFNSNFKGDPLNQKQVITFLSHPHWFNKDNPRMEQLLKYLDSYKAEKGDGPLIYTTIEKSYDIYAN